VNSIHPTLTTALADRYLVERELGAGGSFARKGSY